MIRDLRNFSYHTLSSSTVELSIHASTIWELEILWIIHICSIVSLGSLPLKAVQIFSLSMLQSDYVANLTCLCRRSKGTTDHKKPQCISI